ncbi:MAG: FAD-dependent oxidoreductase, partial [Bdellovibrionota bacterium]
MDRGKVLILGTGIAGLSAALKFAKQAKVTLVCKADRVEGATRYAQGGIASVWSKQDSFEEHKQDTLVAGAGLCHEEIVDLCVREG